MFSRCLRKVEVYIPKHLSLLWFALPHYIFFEMEDDPWSLHLAMHTIILLYYSLPQIYSAIKQILVGKNLVGPCNHVFFLLVLLLEPARN